APKPYSLPTDRKELPVDARPRTDGGAAADRGLAVPQGVGLSPTPGLGGEYHLRSVHGFGSRSSRIPPGSGSFVTGRYPFWRRLQFVQVDELAVAPVAKQAEGRQADAVGNRSHRAVGEHRVEAGRV